MDTAKERVEQELKELSDKIAKLVAFLYSEKILNAGLSREMLFKMEEQLTYMLEYAKCLQSRLRIWGKTDEDLEKERCNAKIGCVM